MPAVNVNIQPEIIRWALSQTQNEADLKTAIDNVFNPVVYTTEEGFQHDNSYFQHGEQLYIGGYGDEILKGVTQVASYALAHSINWIKRK